MIAATKAAGLSPIHSLNHNKPIQPTICADIGVSCTTSPHLPLHPSPPPPPPSSKPKPKRTTRSSPSLLTRLVVVVWDFSWRQWYNFIATWGISVMEPWERIFALSLMAAFVALMGVALVKLPSCVGYALSRGGVLRLWSSTAFDGSVGGGGGGGRGCKEGGGGWGGVGVVDGSRAGYVGEGGMVDVDMCRKAFERGLLRFADNVSDVGGGAVGASWAVSS
ncbi:uncharacterized protein SPSC_00167 [Sporisorium scitamineum]|uniref:Uncharacterized protein n=1 Tax=Sporisorium scitamineum TaxID=49012 RepID=A0A127Z5K6_9BASI|nr:uncharacterized protein SPSC_00167 [Sporisorium scitamineum]